MKIKSGTRNLQDSTDLSLGACFVQAEGRLVSSPQPSVPWEEIGLHKVNVMVKRSVAVLLDGDGCSYWNSGDDFVY